MVTSFFPTLLAWTRGGFEMNYVLVRADIHILSHQRPQSSSRHRYEYMYDFNGTNRFRGTRRMFVTHAG